MYLPHRWHHGLLAAGAFGLPLALAFLLAQFIDARRTPGEIFRAPELARIDPASPQQLLDIFDSHEYSWPPGESVPPLALESLPANLETLPAPEKKSLFFRSLLPLVLAENARIAERRAFLQQTFAAGPLAGDSTTAKLVADIAARYAVEGDLNDPAVRELLLRRVDTVPPSLVLAQAAIESGWGTSRFAQQANNLFGIWTWKAEEGLVPEQRAEDADHYVRKYGDIRGSVRSYLHNINVGRAYQEFRLLRARMRSSDIPLDVLDLAGTMQNYSIRGEAYVEDVQLMITANELQRLRGVRLRPEEELE